jgi:hypothetical protein
MFILKIDMKILHNPSKSGLNKKYNLRIFMDCEIFDIFFNLFFSNVFSAFILFDVIPKCFG